MKIFLDNLLATEMKRTKFFAIMSVFTRRYKDKNQWNYQWIFDIQNNLKVITLNYVDFVPFSCNDSLYIHNRAN